MKSDIDLSEYLRQNGPSARHELPIDEPTTKFYRWYDEVRKLRISPVRGNERGLGSQTSVFYVQDHDLTDVVRKYVDENPSLLDLTCGAITQYFGSHSREMKEAWREISNDYDLRTAGKTRKGPYETFECTFCGEQIKEYPSHLPDCEEA